MILSGHLIHLQFFFLSSFGCLSILNPRALLRMTALGSSRWFSFVVAIMASFATRLGVQIGCLLAVHESRVIFSLPARPRLKEEDWYDESASHDSSRT